MKVIVYVKDNCPDCINTKNDFIRRGIEFLERPAHENLHYLKTTLGFKSAPVVVTPIGNWCGYNPEKIEFLSNVLFEGSSIRNKW